MLDALDITEDEAAGLSALAAIDLAMARRFGERALAAEDPETANRLARTAQRAARSYRQTLALKVRLRRAIAEHAREYPQKRDARSIARKMDEVRRAVTRVAWAEREAYEGPEDERDEIFHDLMSCVGSRLAARAGDPAFDRRALEDEVAAVCVGLGLPVARARAWRDLPDPPADALDPWEDPASEPP